MTLGSGFEILVIEDNLGDARLIEELLIDSEELVQRVAPHVTDGGVPQVQHEPRLSSGISYLDANSVDIILLDRHMPEVTGDEVLAELRNRGTSSHIAMLTGVKPAERIVDMPFDDYKIKPVGRAELLGLVEVLLERAKYDAASQEYFRLAAKKAGLEFADNTDTHVYENLVEQMATLREELDDSLDEMSDLAVTDELSV